MFLKYFVSTDHKVIGLLYAFTSLCFLLVGFSLIVIIASYWFYFAGGAVMLVSSFVPGGAANNGWTSYPPLSDLALGHGQTMWLGGMLLIIFSSLLHAGLLHDPHRGGQRRLARAGSRAARRPVARPTRRRDNCFARRSRVCDDFRPESFRFRGESIWLGPCSIQR